MKKRRFSITYHEGELVILSLTALLEDLQSPEFDGSPYWEWNRKAVAELLEKLKTYKWEV